MKKIKSFLIFILCLIPIFDVSAASKVSCAQINDIPSKIPELTSYIVTVIQVAVPVVLVIRGSLDLFRGITAQKEDEIKKGQQILIKRLITALIIFFVIVITKLLVSLVAESNSKNIMDCVDCFISNDCNANFTSSSNSKQPTITGPSSKPNNNTGSDKPNTNSVTSKPATTKPSTSTNNNSTKIKSYLFVGDSRTVGMCGTYKLCEGNEYIAEKDKGYSWFAGTAITKVNNKIASKNYNIIILMGVNDVGSNGTTVANNYFTKISSLAKDSWKNQNIIFVSVNPVKDGKSYAYMSGVNSFNSTMKSKINSSGLKNLKYCDTISKLNMSTIDSGDGLHYNKTGYSTIYDVIKKNCL